MTKFKEISLSEAAVDPFGLSHDWGLVTAAKPDGTVNTMTVSWGGWGIMWHKEVVFIVIRPQRHTKGFVDVAEHFSLSFFEASHKPALTYLGKVSGRDEDKITKSGLTLFENGLTPFFNEARLVFILKKLFVQPLAESSFLDREIIEKWYPAKDFHHLYVAEIKKILTAEI